MVFINSIFIFISMVFINSIFIYLYQFLKLGLKYSNSDYKIGILMLHNIIIYYVKNFVNIGKKYIL